MRLAFFQIHEAPYRQAFLDALAKRIELDVFNYEASDLAHDYWGLGERPSNRKPLGACVRFGGSMLHFTCLVPLWLLRYDAVVVSAHSNLTSILIICWCRLLQVPYVYMADTVSERLRGQVIRWFKRFIYEGAAFLFAPGRASIRFFKDAYGIPSERILAGCYSFNFETVRRMAAKGVGGRIAVRASFGFTSEDRIQIMAANFTKTRNQDELIRNLPTGERLLLIGNGERRAECERLVVELGRSDSVRFVDGLPFDRLVCVLAVCNECVHFANEPFSTVPIVARILGVPVRTGGCVPSAEDIPDTDWFREAFDSERVAERFVQRLSEF